MQGAFQTILFSPFSSPFCVLVMSTSVKSNFVNFLPLFKTVNISSGCGRGHLFTSKLRLTEAAQG